MSDAANARPLGLCCDEDDSAPGRMSVVIDIDIAEHALRGLTQGAGRGG